MHRIFLGKMNLKVDPPVFWTLLPGLLLANLKASAL